MARTVVILIVLFIGIFSATEAALGDNCTDASNCTEPSENCTAGSCGCSNGYFNVSGNCKPNSITVSLSTQSKTAVYGSEVVLTATITSEVSLKPIKWLRGSTELNTNESKYTQTGVGPGQVNLTVQNVNFDDTGDYKVEVSNAAGISNTSNHVTLNVTGVRPIVTVPGTITETGTTVTIHCNASVLQGSPALTAIHWLFKGQNLDISNTSKYSGGAISNPSLSIHNIAPKNAGKYHCVATNLIGSTNSSQSVTLAPPSNAKISATQSVYNGSSITFNGSYTSILGTENKWQKLTGTNFTNIDITNGQYEGSSVESPTPTLVINKVDFIDQTSYRLLVTNGVGSTESNHIALNVIDGSISVTLTLSSTDVKYGVNVILTAAISSYTSVNNNSIKWQKVFPRSQSDLNMNLDKYTQSIEVSGTIRLTIKNVNFNDTGAYQVQVGNIAGTTSTSNQVSLNVRALEFIDSCSNTESCNSSKNLECKQNRCLCASQYYHKDQVCYEKTRLQPTITYLTSTTFSFSVFWSPPNFDSKLVSEYEVTWKATSNTEQTSGRLNNSVNSHNVSSGLMSGQLYTVKVICHVTLTNPSDHIVTSAESMERLVPLRPGQILDDGSNFTHNNLQIKWTIPGNTFVTRYEVTIDGTTYNTSSNTIVQFSGESFIPGKHYYVKIVTVSGDIQTHLKRSEPHAEWIRIIPIRPEPPTDVKCPENPLDTSLEISWKAPEDPNGIIILYLIEVTNRNPSSIYTSSNYTKKNVDGLNPEKTYEFTVQAVNDAIFSTNVSEPSDAVSCTTKAGVSGPPNSLVIGNVKSRGFLIRFSVPSNINGVLAGYKILILQGQNCIQQILIFDKPICDQCVNSSGGCPDPKNYNVSSITMPVSYEATDLNPFTAYLVKVTAINGVGEGYPVNETTKTEEEVPQKPELLTASNIQSTSLILSWNLSAPSPGNTVYTIFVYEVNDEGTNFPLKKQLTVSGFSTQSTEVSDLEEYWLYNFKVNAATGKGNTTSELSRNFTTLQAAPGQVIDLTVNKLNEDNYTIASLSWSLPALRHHNGVLVKYLLNISHDEVTQSEEIPVSLLNTKIERSISVVPETTYFMTVILQNNESMNSPISSYDYTAPAGPPPVSNMEPVDTRPGEHNPTENTITVKIDTDFFRNDENGKQVFFGIAVCEASKCKGLDQITLKNDWETLPNWHMAHTSGFPKYRVTNNTFMEHVRQGVLRRKRSTGKTSDFIIGDDQNCASWNKSVYCNGPLSPGTTYSVIIFACTNGGCTYSIAAGPYETKRIPDDGPPIGIITGAVVAVVVVIVIVGVAFVVVRRRNRLGETKKYTKGLENPMNIDEPLTKNIPRKRPIKLKELSEKVAEKHKDSNLHFAREYEDLKALSPKHPAETSELDENKLKNRYVNILPFDHSRVKLMLTEDDDPSTDFINANYLPGYKSQREYIATQGPIPGTIDDFWRMIWEQNVSIIVMLTLCKEEGRVKCEMYWPENIHEPKQYGDLVVETVSCSTVNFYDFRIFKIKLGDTTRSVKHFHFLQWKDFSANVQNDVMIDFIKNVRNHIRPPDMNGPVVVHCSAGVGRTGTYCALDHLFQFVDEHDLDESIDIFDLVLNLRERRMFMVQTEQQYVFIHDCVRDYVERKRKELQGNLLYENINRGFVSDEPEEDSLYQNYSNQRTDL